MESAPTLASIFTDQMVLPRGKPIPVFGTAAPLSTVTLSFRRRRYTAQADRQGRWSVSLPTQRAGGPYEIEVDQGATHRHLTDLWIGDLWVCSGQSNMEWKVADSADPDREIAAAADHPLIRHFKVPLRESDQPVENPEGSWELCSPQTVGGFTAVGYAFAREIQRVNGVPIGLCNASWGGSEIEPFVPASVFAKNVGLRGWLTRQEQATDLKCHRLGTHYNGMIHALTRLPVKGVLWYQGESNAWNAAQYATLFPAMIRGWRSAWKQPRLPFNFVQLAGFGPHWEPDVHRTWPELREAQSLAVQVPGTDMALAIDLGDRADIHPRNKREVGRRLALLALAHTYGRKRICSGPVYRRQRILKGGIEVEFTQVGRGLRTLDGEPAREFFLSARNGEFSPATATIRHRDKLWLTSEHVDRPAHVRYAWSGHPNVNLVNSAGLPTRPFRTGHWTWTTASARWPAGK